MTRHRTDEGTIRRPEERTAPGLICNKLPGVQDPGCPATGERGHTQVTFSPSRCATRLLLSQAPTRGHEHPDDSVVWSKRRVSKFSRHPRAALHPTAHRSII